MATLIDLFGGHCMDRLPNLCPQASDECGVAGLAFRSPNRLPVRFDA